MLSIRVMSLYLLKLDPDWVSILYTKKQSNIHKTAKVISLEVGKGL